MKHSLIILSILLLTSPLFGQSTKKIDLSLLAKELMLWMQANCNVPDVHPSHNFCNMDFNFPVPKIILMSPSQLVRKFKGSNSKSIPRGAEKFLRGFYSTNDDQIFLVHYDDELINLMGNDYSIIEYQSIVLHELTHYAQHKNGAFFDCPPHIEIPSYLMQLHFYKKKQVGL